MSFTALLSVAHVTVEVGTNYFTSFIILETFICFRKAIIGNKLHYNSEVLLVFCQVKIYNRSTNTNNILMGYFDYMLYYTIIMVMRVVIDINYHYHLYCTKIPLHLEHFGQFQRL